MGVRRGKAQDLDPMLHNMMRSYVVRFFNSVMIKNDDHAGSLEITFSARIPWTPY